MASKRRYPIKEQYRIYSDEFDRLQMQSIVLNSSQRGLTIDHSGDWSDRNFIRSLIMEWKGASGARNVKDGYYIDHNDKSTLAKLPTVTEKLGVLKEQIEQHRKEVETKQGREFKLDSDVQEKLFLLEARFDVVQEEIEELEKIYNQLEEPVREKKKKDILRNGLRGATSLLNGTLSEIHGQSTRLIDNGEDQILVISEEQSPYFGMAVLTYRKLSKAWCAAMNKIDTAQHKLKLKLDKENRLHEFNTEWSKVHDRMMKNNEHWKDLFSISYKGKRLPAWPKGVRNYLKEKETVKSG